jgi:high-affinity iron transporter
VLANFLIGLREGLEAALVVGILVAYLVAIDRRDVLPKLWLGVSLAVGLSASVGALLTFGAYGLNFHAQETIAGVLSIIATALVTWMIFWMVRSAKGLSHELRASIDSQLGGRETLKGTGVGWGIVAVGFISVAREGIETALFLWAAVKASGSTALPLLGAALGLAGAIGVGFLLYRGVLKINLSRFFAWTGGFLIIVAAGVLAYGIHDLQEAGVVPGLTNLAFDVSTVISPDSWYGTLLIGIFNFSPATSWGQLIAWIAYVVPVLTVFVFRIRRNTPTPRRINQ